LIKIIVAPENIFFKELFLILKRKSSVTLFIIQNIIDIPKFFVLCTSPAGLSCGHTQQQAKSLPLPQLAGCWKSGSGLWGDRGNCGFGGLEDQRTGEPETRRRSCWRRPLGRDHRSDLTRFKPSHMLSVFFLLNIHQSCLHLFHFKLH